MGAEGVPGFHARLLPCSRAGAERTPSARLRVSLLAFPGHADVAVVSWLCFCHGLDAAAVHCMAVEFVCQTHLWMTAAGHTAMLDQFGAVSRIADAVAISRGAVSGPLRHSLHNSAGDRFACLLRGLSRRFAERPAALDLSGAGCDFVSWLPCSGVRRSGRCRRGSGFRSAQ